MKKYILGIILSAFAMTIVFSQGTAVLAANTNAQVTTTAKESATTTVSNSKTNANKEDSSSNKAVFVQDTLPQTGVEANHSGLYFSIAGFFLLLAFFTSRSKLSKRNDVSDKQKK
ncbi:LPXTG cell wall anchor domain-containing protein [Rummeliibacillus pycnus]|uniref:LPXTG cell wall anchor domain-containing protein n=1 Tax=Rummeliibacillus pycnus TaxID=101070 RepID=UPI003D2728B0